MRQSEVIAPEYLSKLLQPLLIDLERHGQQAKYFNDVTLWAKDMLGVDLWYKQTEIADDVARGTSKSVAVRAGHGVGKSFLAGILACWWIDTRPIQYVFVASTAPSADQVSAILWREIRNNWSISHKRHKEFRDLTERGLPTGNLPDHPLPGYITQENKWKDDLGNLIGQGRKPPDNKEDSFQGIHAEYVLAIGDEACGLRESMIDDLSNITSNEKSRRVLIGNPTNPRSRFGDIFLDTTLRKSEDDDGNEIMVSLQDIWSLHQISVLDSPNFHGFEVCDRGCARYAEHQLLPPGLGLDAHALKSLTDKSYVIEKKGEYGEDSARYKARVLGEFAYDEGNTLFEDYDIAKARDAGVFIDYEDPKTSTVLGVDVARSKYGDTTFVYRFTTGLMHDWHEETDPTDGSTSLVMGGVGARVGGELRFVDKYRGTPLTDRYEEDGAFTIGQATLINQHAIDLNATEVRVDSGGLGIGLVDGLKKLSWDKSRRRHRYRVIEMQSGAPTPDGRQWTNNRAFQYAQMRDRFRDGLIGIDPEDKLLIQQLEDILFEFVDPHGALQIESKVSMKKRGVKSPDAADAAWYACADLKHLEGPKDGDVLVQTPEQLMAELMLSGFTDPYPF